MSRFFLTLSILFFSGQTYSESAIDYDSAYKCDGASKFNWYCDEQKNIETPKKIKIVPPKLSYEEQKLKEFDELQKRMEDLRKIAIIDRTYENIKNYIVIQNQVQEMSAEFTDKWRRILWSNPELDYSVKHTVNTVGKRTAQNLLDNAKLATLKELTEQGWGLWFFYSSTCHYCHEMVPVINHMSKKDMRVLPVSIDGPSLPSLDVPSTVDNGQARELGVTVTPSVFLVNTNTRVVAPIASGMVSYDDLLTRIYIVTQTEPGDNY